MLHNYLKIAFRNLLRQKAFSVLSIAGLATGMMCCILILLWVQDELSYDRFHFRSDSLFRLTILDQKGDQAAVTNAPLPLAMKAELPEVEEVARIRVGYSAETQFETGTRRFTEKRVVFADSTFLHLFSFPLVKGDPHTALSRPDGLLLTEEMAQKYFGGEEALGQTVRMDNQSELTVVGVLRNIPENSHLQFDFLLPMAFLARTDHDLRNGDWANFNFHGYVRLNERLAPTRENLARLEEQINELHKKHRPEDFLMTRLQPLTDIHLHSQNISYDVGAHGNIQYVRVFGVVALFVLLVACINFMNLATARSARRAKEVGLRKVVGAGRFQLIGQFLGESLVVTGLSLVLALILVELFLPFFNSLVGKSLEVSYADSRILLGLMGIFLLTGVLSGSYPAFFLSAFQPARVLKGVARQGSGGVLFRNGLVVVQFVVSIALMLGTAVVYKQLQFMQNKNLGYDKENLLYVPLKGELNMNQRALATELARHPATAAFTFTSGLTTDLASGTDMVEWEGKDPSFKPMVSAMTVDERFGEVFGVQLLAGKFFDKDFNPESGAYIVNEKALQLMGMEPATAIGKPLTLWNMPGTIIGVVKDFNFRSVHHPVEPIILRQFPWKAFLVLRTKPGQMESTLAEVEDIWKKITPDHSFTFGFLDQDLANLYQVEQRMGRIFNGFALLAIFISCLGLYGLAAFIAEQRTKEIGIRKVLGASIGNILGLLSRDFVKLVALAFVVAAPLAWYAMHRWLEGYAYRISPEWWMFAVAGLLSLLIALFTVSFQALKAAVANPVKSLRSE